MKDNLSFYKDDRNVAFNPRYWLYRTSAGAEIVLVQSRFSLGAGAMIGQAV